MMLRTPLGRVRGLGSAKEGVTHWWTQRVTALALIPLAVWFVASVISLAGAGYEAVAIWLGSPVVAGLMILLLIATFYHAALGLQAAVEDYVHDEGAKLAAILIIKALCLVLGLTGVLAVLKLAFGGL